MDAAKEGFVEGVVLERQVVGHGVEVGFAGAVGICQEALDLGAEADDAVGIVRGDAIVERLDAEVVAPQHQLPAVAIEDRKPKHAPQLPHHLGHRPPPYAFVEANERLGIAVRAELLALCGQCGVDLAVVVELPVVDDAHRAIVIPHGLVSTGQVDDRQAGHAEGEVIADVVAHVIGTSVPDDLEHRPDEAARLVAGAEDTGDTAHGARRPLVESSRK